MSFFISFSRCPLEEGEWKSILVGVRLQSEANPPHKAKQSPRQPASIPYIFTWWSYMLMGVCLMKQSQHRGSQTGLVLGLMMSVLSPFTTAESSSQPPLPLWSASDHHPPSPYGFCHLLDSSLVLRSCSLDLVPQICIFILSQVSGAIGLGLEGRTKNIVWFTLPYNLSCSFLPLWSSNSGFYSMADALFVLLLYGGDRSQRQHPWARNFPISCPFAAWCYAQEHWKRSPPATTM